MPSHASPTTPLQRNRATFLFLAPRHQDAPGAAGGARAVDPVALPSCENRSPRFHPKPLAEPLRACSVRAALLTPPGRNLGCGVRRTVAARPGDAGPSPPGCGGHRHPAAPRPEPRSVPSPGRDTTALGPGTARDRAWRERRSGNDGEGGARAPGGPAPAAAL